MEEVKKVETTKEVVSGNNIVGLFPTIPSAKVQVEYDGKLLEFEVEALDNETFAKVGDKIKVSNIDLSGNESSLAGMKIISDLYWPALKIVLPKCCINPKFVDGVSTDINTISVNTIKLEVGVALFDKILAMSGLGATKIEERKK